MDKYKIAAEIKINNPDITHKKALDISKEAVKIYFNNNCTPKEAIEKAKGMILSETNRNDRSD